jgi:hypothetical protein
MRGHMEIINMQAHNYFPWQEVADEAWVLGI